MDLHARDFSMSRRNGNLESHWPCVVGELVLGSLPTPTEARLRRTRVGNSQGASRPRLLFVAARTGPYFASVSERLPQPSLCVRMAGEEIGEKSLGE